MSMQIFTTLCVECRITLQSWGYADNPVSRATQPAAAYIVMNSRTVYNVSCIQGC